MTTYDDRVRNAQNELKKRKWDALAINLGINHLYFTGQVKVPSERLMTTVVPADGKPFIITPAFEADLVRETVQMNVGEIITWEESDNPYGSLGKALKARNLDKGNIAVDGRFEYRLVFPMQNALPKAKFHLGDELITNLRIIKSEEEVRLMKEACKLIAKGQRAAFEAAAPGRTEDELARVLKEQITAGGGRTTSLGGMTSGPVTALPHATTSDRKISRDEMLLSDIGCTYKGYYGDLTRTAILGKPTDKMKKIYAIVLEAQRKAIMTSAPGVECQAVDESARKIITDAGYGPNFTHRVGHGIGLEVHEDPFLVNGNKQKLQTGMVHSVEPGIYLLNEFGVRIEDDVVVTKTGREVLSEGLFPTDELMSVGA